MAWTPVSQPSATWTHDAQDAAKRVFSRDVFSHSTFGGKLIFAVGSPAGIWAKDAAPSSTWARDAS